MLLQSGTEVTTSAIKPGKLIFLISSFFYGAFRDTSSSEMCIFKVAKEVGATGTAFGFFRCTNPSVITPFKDDMTFYVADNYIMTHSFMTCISSSYCSYTYGESFTVLDLAGTQIVNGYQGTSYSYEQ